MNKTRTEPNEFYIENPFLRLLNSVFILVILLTGAKIFVFSFRDVSSFSSYSADLSFLDFLKQINPFITLVNHWQLSLSLLLLFFMAVSEKERQVVVIEDKSVAEAVVTKKIKRERGHGNLNIVIPHKLTQEEALRRVKDLLVGVKNEHADKIDSLKESWSGEVGTFTLVAKGYTVSGTLVVETDYIEVDGHLPFPASMAKGMISKIITERAVAILA